MARDEADDDPGATAGEAPKDKKKDQKKQTVIAVASVAGVVVAFLIFRSRSGGGSAPATMSPGGSIGTYTPSGNVVGSGTDPSAVQGLSTLLGNQSLQLQSLEAAIAGLTPAQSTADTPAVTPPAFELGAAAADDTYVRNDTTGAIYQVQPGQGGTAPNFVYLNGQQYAALGKPAFTGYPNS